MAAKRSTHSSDGWNHRRKSAREKPVKGSIHNLHLYEQVTPLDNLMAEGTTAKLGTLLCHD